VLKVPGCIREGVDRCKVSGWTREGWTSVKRTTIPSTSASGRHQHWVDFVAILVESRPLSDLVGYHERMFDQMLDRLPLSHAVVQPQATSQHVEWEEKDQPMDIPG